MHLRITRVSGTWHLKKTKAERPIVVAAQKGYLNAVKFLLDNGAEGTAKSSSGFTALSAAATGGRLDVVVYLLEKYGDQWRGHDEDIDFWDAYSLAQQGDHKDVMTKMLNHASHGDRTGRTRRTFMK